MFPAQYQGGVFVAAHGSWNRTKASGGLVNFVSLKADGSADKSTVFAEGWLDQRDRQIYRGRPVDVAVMEGRLAAGVGRLRRRDLPHQLPALMRTAGLSRFLALTFA
jgi:hypothetical protein